MTIGNTDGHSPEAIRQAFVYAKFSAKADKLLKEGDRAYAEGRKAEAKRLWRECRRMRLKARDA